MRFGVLAQLLASPNTVIAVDQNAIRSEAVSEVQRLRVVKRMCIRRQKFGDFHHVDVLGSLIHVLFPAAPVITRLPLLHRPPIG